MPEIKNVFRTGIMNKDDDERIIPNGQYRDAMNVQVSTSESSEVGTVQNILGNTRVEDIVNISNAKCVGAVADEKNDVLYWFITSPAVDAIVEYRNDPTNQSTNTCTPILVDTNKDVLKFDPANVITGINIIDNLLFWTDNVNEPKKINIDTFKLNPNTDLNTHSKMFVNEDEVGDVTEDHITVIRKRPQKAPTVVFSEVGAQDVFHFYAPGTPDTGFSFHDFEVGSTGSIQLYINALNSPYNEDDILLLLQNDAIGNLPQTYDVKIKVTSNPTQVVVFGSVIVGYIVPFEVLEINPEFIVDEKLNFDVVKEVDIDPIFERELIRFATRWKYSDGEYSAFSPFTQPVFFAGAFGFHPTQDPYNLAMENRIVALNLQDLIPVDTPDDVIQLDILFKKERSTTIYSIESIKPDDPSPSDYWNKNNYAQKTILSENYPIIGDITTTYHVPSSTWGGYESKGEYEITVENIYAALPENQTLRPWDNVPRKALAQEITANRIVYGNYLQNYNLKTIADEIVKPRISLAFEDRDILGNAPVFLNSMGKKSIKSLRKYYLGVVYGDKYGRETPVFTSRDASINIPFDQDLSSIFNGTADKSLRLTASLQGNPPEWAQYFKYFIKQTTGEYYNLTMDRVYKALGDSNLWLSFPSSDRNKIQEGDYFSIKKQVDLEQMIPVENKIKIIDIKNEAPESIKFDYIPLGTVGGNEDVLGDLFPDISAMPGEGVKRLLLDKNTWEDEGGLALEDLSKSDKLAIQFTVVESGITTHSERYFIAGFSVQDNGGDLLYNLVLRKIIQPQDDWVEQAAGVLNSDDGLEVTVYRLIEKAATEFEGRFFVKIISNPATQTYLVPSTSDTLNFATLAKAKCFNLRDKAATFGSNSGVYNTANSWVQNEFISGSSYPTSTRTEAEWHDATEWDTSVGSTQGWFIDSTTFAAVQHPDKFDARHSGRFTKGNPLASTGQYINGFEGVVSPVNNAGGAPIDSALHDITDTLYKTVNTGTPHGPRHFSNKPMHLQSGDYQTVDSGGVNYIGGGDYTQSPYRLVDDGGHFIHLSFFAPGVDLHDGNYDPLLAQIEDKWAYNNNNVAKHYGDIFTYGLQRIRATSIYIDGIHNHDDNYWNFPTVPSNANNMNSWSGTQEEEHKNQWNPGYLNPGAQSVVNQLKNGSRFKIVNDEQGTVYTIKDVTKIKLYNHTAWNPNPTRKSNGDLNPWIPLDNNGNPSILTSVSVAMQQFMYDQAGQSYDTTWFYTMMDTIYNFGKANNRRVCYILQVDKDPLTNSTFSGLPWLDSTGLPTAGSSSIIRFVDNYIEPGANTMPTSPAIFETEAKEDVDLNIYHEASDALPIALTNNQDSNYYENGHLLGPVGSKVTCSLVGSLPNIDAANLIHTTADFYPTVTGWEGNIVEINNPGFIDQTLLTPPGNNDDYVGKTLTFWREDSGYTTAIIHNAHEITGNYITKFALNFTTASNKVGLPYYNCFSFGNGVESNRIRDDFNESYILNGVKASTVLEEPYEEERRKYGLIYSGLYNSTSGINNLNQFIQAEKITKDLMPSYGSIQKLYARDKDLITLCEDKIIQIFVDKDILYNADGNTQLLATNRVLGTAQPFRGNYGISKNPESFAAESFRAYFTDKQRGAVMRLSMDGLTPISDAGMHDYFRDNLRDGGRLYGNYDAHKGDYNLSISYETGINEVCNPGFEEGLTTDTQLVSNILLNHGFSNTTTVFTDNLLSSANSGFESGATWSSYGTQGSAGAIYTVASPSGIYGSKSALFFHNQSSGVSNGNAWAYLDISSLGINDGDTVKIEWEMYLAGDHVETEFSLPSTTVNNAKPSTDPFKVTMHNDNSGAIITNSDISSVSGGSYANTYSFTRTMNTSNVPSSGAPNTGANENTLRIISQSLEEMNHVFVDNVSVKKEVTTTDDWTLNNNVVNNGGTLEFANGGQAVQSNAIGVEAGKLYRIRTAVSGFTGQPWYTINGVNVNIQDEYVTYSGILMAQRYFPNTSTDIVVEVNGGTLDIDSITIQEYEPYGGDVECWNLNGADSTFLYTSQSGGGGSIIFDEAPEDTYLHQNLINTNRILDFTDGAKCNVTFDVTNYTGTGELTFRLYNEDGEGFEYPISGNGSYSFSSTIGNNTSTTLTSKFGFYVSSTDNFSGEIDNISLILDGEGAGKTISFNEQSKGWTSFKSFVPEFGLSCVNQYYTMNLGQLWKHHTNETRNTFYGVGPDQNVGAESSITPILNMQPEVVKNFNTLNYEGSQSRVDQFLTYEVTQDEPFPAGDNLIINANTFFHGVSFFTQAPNSNASFTSPSTGNISIVDFHGESGHSDLINITMPNLDTAKTYRLSFGFSVTSASGQSDHVYFGVSHTQIPSLPIISTSLSGGVFSEDFTPVMTTEYLSIIHPNMLDGFTQDVNVELTDILLQELDFTADQNDGEYYNLQAKPGWYVSNIHTNKQEGTLHEFIEKEGKWFNYIKGKPGQIDPAAFNFQGLGIVEIIE